MKKMLYKLTYGINQKTYDEYLKFAEKNAIPYWMGVKGLTEFRAYRDSAKGMAVVEMEFKDFTSWGKAMDTKECKDLMSKFSTYINNCEWTLYDGSPVIPKPLKP